METNDEYINGYRIGVRDGQDIALKDIIDIIQDCWNKNPEFSGYRQDLAYTLLSELIKRSK
jgi:hypothetical protein